MAWTLSGVIGSQLGDVQDMITVEGQTLTVQKYIDDSYGFSKDALWYTVLILLGFSIAFWFVVAGKETMLAPLTCLIVHGHDCVALLWAWQEPKVNIASLVIQMDPSLIAVTTMCKSICMHKAVGDMKWQYLDLCMSHQRENCMLTEE